MAVTEELRAGIDNEIGALNPEDLLRAGKSYDDFVEYYSNTLGQAREDKNMLVEAGFDWELMPKFEGYLTMLTEAHARRVALTGQRAEAVKEFEDTLPDAVRRNKILLAVARYVVLKSGDKDARKSYRWVRKGFGDIDTLNDNAILVELMQKYPDLAAKVRPGGVVVDSTFLDETKKQALHLIGLNGDATAASDKGNELVDRQNRLITLCIEAQREIKLFAEMAYLDDPEAYAAKYVDSRGASRSSDSSEPDTAIDEEDEDIVNEDLGIAPSAV